MFEYEAEVTRVVDGDTYDVNVDLGFNIKMSMRVRMKDVDTPETWRPRNLEENVHGEQATAFVLKTFEEANNKITIRTYKAGASIYGRYEADVIVNGQDLGELLVANGFEKKESY